MKRSEIKIIYYAGVLIGGFGMFLILSSYGWKAFVAVALIGVGYSLMQPELWILIKEMVEEEKPENRSMPSYKNPPPPPSPIMMSSAERYARFSTLIKDEESKLKKHLEEAKKDLIIARVKEAQEQINEILKDLTNADKT